MPRGLYAPGVAHTSCVRRDGGKFHRTGEVQLRVARRARARNADPAAACAECAAGFYAAQTEQIRCDQCAGGEYQTSGGQSSCITCATGTYRERSAKPSRPARHALRAGSLAQERLCYRIPPGSYYSSSNHEIIQCEAGSDAVVLLLVAMPVVKRDVLQALVPFSVWIAYQASTKMILEEANALTARGWISVRQGSTKCQLPGPDRIAGAGRMSS